MHAVTRYGPLIGLALLLIAPPGWSREGMAVVGVAQTAALIGTPAPDFSLPSLNAGAPPVRLADYRGKVVYLDFWSAWCAPCRRAMPRLDALRRTVSRDDFEVVGVNVDAEAADARRYLDGVSVGYPLVADGAGEVARGFGVSLLPALVIIGPDGVVRDALVGGDVEARAGSRRALAELIAQGEAR